MEDEAFALEAFALASRVKPLLAGKHPAVQGAALAELLSLWLAGHPAEVREQLLENHIDTVRKLVPANAAIIRGER